jgi:hypothetical protein
LADPNELWLLETSGHNWVAKPIINDVVSTTSEYTIGTDWDDPGNLYNSDILVNAAAHGCETDPLNWAECFGNDSPAMYTLEIRELKARGDITVEDMRVLVQHRAATDEAIVGLTRPHKDQAYYTVIWDSRADPHYGNIFIPRWIAMDANALPEHYTSWVPQDPEAAHLIFKTIVDDYELRERARLIWQALQSQLYDEFSTVEARMQEYIDEGDFAGLQMYINGYIYETSENAYNQALEIIGTVDIPDFPVILQGSPPEEQTVTLNVVKPSDTTEASLTLTVYDPDFPDEGQLYINGNGPIELFGAFGVSENDYQTVTLTWTTPSLWWTDGSNILTFTHLQTAGYTIDDAWVQFDDQPWVPDTTPPEWDSPDAEGICSTVDNQSSGSVTVDFGTATDDQDASSVSYNIYYAPTAIWDAINWSNNYSVSVIVPDSGTFCTNSFTLTGLENNTGYTFGVRVEDLSENEDENVNTAIATPTPGVFGSFPVNMQGSTPEEQSVTLNVVKPSDTTEASLSLTVYDPDFPDEGQLYINGNGPIELFGAFGVSENDYQTVTLTWTTPSLWWADGSNTLTFTHLQTAGYIIEDALVQFDDQPWVPDTTPPQWDSPAAEGICSAADNQSSGSVTVDFGTATDDQDASSVTYKMTKTPLV